MIHYVLQDLLGPIGVYTDSKELARDLRKLKSEGIELDYLQVLKFVGGRINISPRVLSISNILRKNRADLYLQV
jgi:hypothetical protein